MESLGRHLLTYDEYMKKLGKNLNVSMNMYKNAYKEFGKIDKDVLKITGTSPELEAILLDKPALAGDE